MPLVAFLHVGGELPGLVLKPALLDFRLRVKSGHFRGQRCLFGVEPFAVGMQPGSL